MRIIDISMLIKAGMPTYKDRPEKAPLRTWAARLPHDSVNESVYTINMHTGTHLDAPLHMTDGGQTTAEALPLERLITKAKVFDLSHVEDGASFIYLKESGANYLAQKKVNGVGIDALGIERDQPGHKSHHALLDRGIIILEGLVLSDAAPGEYTLIALPLKLDGAEGAPTRAVLVEGL